MVRPATHNNAQLLSCYLVHRIQCRNKKFVQFSKEKQRNIVSISLKAVDMALLTLSAEHRKPDLEVTALYFNENDAVQHMHLVNIPVWFGLLSDLKYRCMWD